MAALFRPVMPAALPVPYLIVIPTFPGDLAILTTEVISVPVTA